MKLNLPNGKKILSVFLTSLAIFSSTQMVSTVSKLLAFPNASGQSGRMRDISEVKRNGE